jgi:broad specificity phosphatase PhoE
VSDRGIGAAVDRGEVDALDGLLRDGGRKGSAVGARAVFLLFFRPVPPSEIASPPTRRIYLVRHGETLYGAGATSGDDLTPAGYRQIEALEQLLRPTAIDAIYASPLERAQATARTLAGLSGVPITTIDTLREIIPGDLSVLSASTSQDVAGFLRQAIGYFVDPETRWDTPYLGGETYRSLRERVWPFFVELTQRTDWRRAVVVAHGGVNNALIGRILGTGEPGLANVEQDFGGLNIIDLVDGRPVLRLLNFTAYDPLKAGLEASSMDILRSILERGLGVSMTPSGGGG